MSADTGPARRATRPVRFVFGVLVVLALLIAGWSHRGTERGLEPARPGGEGDPAADRPEDVATSDVRPVEAEFARETIDVSIEDGGRTIRGIVQDSWMDPVPAVSVFLRAVDSGGKPRVILAARSDAAGRVRFRPLPVEAGWRLTVRVTAPGRVASEHPLDTAAILRDEPFRIRLAWGRTVRGTLVDGGGNPVPGARVQRASADGPEAASVRSDGEGRFELTRVPLLGRRVLISGLGASRVVPIPDGIHGEVVDLGEIRLDAAVNLGGIVVDEHGEPLEGARVRLETGDSAVAGGTAETDAKGRFAFAGIPPGEYAIVATMEIPDFGKRTGRTGRVVTRGDDVVVRILPGRALVLRFHDAAAPDEPLTVGSYWVRIRDGTGSFGGGGASTRGYTFFRSDLEPGVYGVTVRILGYREVDLGQVTVTEHEDSVLDVLLTVE